MSEQTWIPEPTAKEAIFVFLPKAAHEGHIEVVSVVTDELEFVGFIVDLLLGFQ